MIDTHAHLDACEEDAGTLVARALAAGVERIVTIGAGIEASHAAIGLASTYEEVYAVVGIDPHKATTDAGRAQELDELVGRPRVVAVGETGLDYHYGADAKPEQRRLLDAHLALASDAGLPLVIHCREAAADTAAALAGFAGPVVLHCFSEPSLLTTALERGYFVSFAGNVTYPRAEDLRAAASEVPADRLLVETDSPYLSPQPRRGRPNEPANLVHTVAVLADTLGATPGEIAERTAANARAAFGVP